MRFRLNPFKGLIVLSGTGVAVFALGLAVFARCATGDGLEPAARADAIVVLTGGEQRLEEAFRLLKEGRGQRLLISGINPLVSREDLRRLADIDARTFDARVDLGYAALNTSGNADETRAWAQHWRYSSLIIVTSSYHMPRSLSEIGRCLPHVTLIPDPVLPKSFRQQPWWQNASSTRLLLGEYVKWLPSVARYGIARLSQWKDDARAALPRAPLPGPEQPPDLGAALAKSTLLEPKSHVRQKSQPTTAPEGQSRRTGRSDI